MDTADGWIDMVGSGSIWIKHIVEGEGHSDEYPPRPGDGQAVDIRYVARVKGGELFEEHMDQPRRIRLGDTDVPSGVEMSIRMICPGGKAHVKLASRHGYNDGRDLEYEIELVSLGSVLAECDFSVEQRMAAAEEDVTKGADRYREGQVAAAERLFARGCKILSETGEDESVQFQDLKVRLENNASQVAMHLDKLKEAECHASRVLILEPDNSKALFRMGSVCLQLQDFEAASLHAGRGLELDPQSKQFSALCKKIERAAAKFKKKEKKTMSKMFAPKKDGVNTDTNTETEAKRQNGTESEDPVSDAGSAVQANEEARVDGKEEEKTADTMWTTVRNVANRAQLVLALVVFIGVAVQWYFDGKFISHTHSLW